MTAKTTGFTRVSNQFARSTGTHQMSGVKFSIITPSFRSSEWLKLCIASVADQQGVEYEHIVQDACSDDGTQEWLPRERRVKAFVEKDSGMYDAVNRGIRRSSGELLAYINCDEQYLPEALQKVHECFEQNPAADMVISHFVVIDKEGEYLCHRYATQPTWAAAWDRISISTCALFFRRRVFEQHGLWFDPNWRDVSDTMWILSACKKRLKWALLPTFTSAFADTGENMNLKPNARRENVALLKMRPWWLKASASLVRMRYRARLLRSGMFRQPPFSYSIYTRESPAHRKTFQVDHPSGRWKSRS
jgi:glycosyltransferase involved in cell wall biosynthesis